MRAAGIYHLDYYAAFSRKPPIPTPMRIAVASSLNATEICLGNGLGGFGRNPHSLFPAIISRAFSLNTSEGAREYGISGFVENPLSYFQECSKSPFL